MIWVAPWMGFLKKWEVKATEPTLASKEQPGASFKESLALLKNRNVLGIFLGFFAYNYVWNVFQSWLPNYLSDGAWVHQDRDGSIKLRCLWCAMSVIIVISGALSDWLIRRGYEEKRVRKIFIATGMLVCCLIVPAGFVEDRMTAVWLLFISLSGLGIASPNTWTLTQAVSSKQIVGTVSGIQNTGGNMGAILAPMADWFHRAIHRFICDGAGAVRCYPRRRSNRLLALGRREESNSLTNPQQHRAEERKRKRRK